MISEKILEKLRQSTKEEMPQAEGVQGFTRASELGWVDDCPRYLCLRRLCPKAETEKDEKSKARLREGKKQETLIREELQAAGVVLHHRGRLSWPALRLTGELDDTVVFEDNEYPIDYKTASSAMFARIRRARSKEDLLHSPFIWIRHYPAQLQAYMLLTQLQPSLILFKDKEAGEKHLIDIELDPVYSSRLIDGVRQVNEWVEHENPPKAESKEACEGCGFQNFDFPESERTALSGEIEIITDDEWLLKLREYQQLIDAGIAKSAKELEKLDKEIKEEFRGRKALIGSHLVESKQYFSTYLDVPEEERAKFQKQREQFRTSIKLVGGKL